MKRIPTLIAVAQLVLLLIAPGCTDETPIEPEVEPTSVSFTPQNENLLLQLDEVIDLGVEVSGGEVEWLVIFLHDQTVMTHDPDYSYVASDLGPDSLEAVVTLPDRFVRWKWNIEVVVGGAPRPPCVTEFSVDNDTDPGTVRIEWNNPPEPSSPRAVTGFQLRVSYGEPLTSENWEQAEILDWVDLDPEAQTCSISYDPETNSAIRPAEQAWFGIRTKDEIGIMSDLCPVCMLDICPLLPLRVDYYSVVNGVDSGSIVMDWYNPADAPGHRPIAGYQLRVSYDAELDSDTWDQAEVLDYVDFTEGSQAYHRLYDAATCPALRTGVRGWFGMKTEDDAGVLSVVSRVVQLDISGPFEVTGHVTDYLGNPMSDVLVFHGDDCATCRTFTDASGFYSLTGLRDDRKHVLTFDYDGIGPDSIGDCYGVVTDSIGVDDATDIDIIMLERRTLTSACDIGGYEAEFLNLLRHLTMTGPYNSSQVFNSDDVLRKWEEYPIDIYIPEGTNLAGNLNLGEMLRWCINAWNTEMGEVYFREVPTIEEADVQGRFMNIGPTGQVVVVRPSGVMNNVIPEFCTLTIDTQVMLEEYTTEVMMHELGHALCVGVHSICISQSQVAYHLMASPPANIIRYQGWNNIVSADEEAVIHMIRYLPQGMRLGGYFID